MAILSTTRLGLAYGDYDVFKDVTVEMAEGARVGIVGPNGSGKTSLLRTLIGDLEPSFGAVLRAKGIRIGYVPQSAKPLENGTLRDEIASAFEELARMEASIEALAQEIERTEGAQQQRAVERHASLLARYEAMGGYDKEHTMERVCAGVGLSEEALDTPAAAASGGERTRAALAKALLAEPDLLALDEPTNHLDLKGLAWLEKFLSRYQHSFLVVSHDRYFLERVVTQMWELERGRVNVFKGNYSAYRAQKAEQVARQQKEYEKQQEVIARLESFIARYHAGQRAQEAKDRAKKLERLERIEAPQQQSGILIPKVTATRTGQVVLSTKGLKAGYFEDGRAVTLLSVPDVKLDRGARAGIIGDNGAGKTTLLKTILGLSPPVEGEATLGHNVRAGYYRQVAEDLPEESNVLEALLDVHDMSPLEARSYLARFLFTGDDVFQPVHSLSGGERSRLALARLLIAEPNFLVLDEPTNHLDIPSCEALEQVLMSYNGTLLFVSHDRQLVSRLATQLWVVAGGTVKPFNGTFEEWARSAPETAEFVAKPVQPARAAPKRRQPQRPKQQPRIFFAPRKGPKQGPAPPPETIEEAIERLEARLRDIDAELQTAATNQELEAIDRLAKEHTRVEAELDRKLEEWVK